MLFRSTYFSKYDNNVVFVNNSLTKSTVFSACSISNNVFIGGNKNVKGVGITANSSTLTNIFTNNVFEGKMQYGFKDNQGYTDVDIKNSPTKIKTFDSNVFSYTTA